MKYTAVPSLPATPEEIAKQLMYFFQSIWAENVDKQTQNGRELGFGELTEFVSPMTRIARSRLGQLAESLKKNFGSGTTSKGILPITLIRAISRTS